MKLFLFIFTSGFMVFTSNTTYAKDVIALYNAECSGKGQSASFCSCALDAFSEKLRKHDTKKMPEIERYYQDELSQLLKDPALNQQKIDATCDLYDQSIEYEKQARKVDPRDPQKRELMNKKVEVMNEKEKLVMSYGALPASNGTLVHGKLCENRATYAQMEKDTANDNGGVYPAATRKMENMLSYGMIISVGHGAGCK